METSTRVALVTGAAQGIGRRTAIELASRGYTVVLNDVQPVDAVAAEIEAAGGQTYSVIVGKSAGGTSGYVRPLNSQSLQAADEGAHVIRYAEALGRIRGPAAARHVPGDHRKLVRQACELVAPLPAVRWASVQQNQRRPVPRTAIGDSKSLDLGRLSVVPQL